ncbi:hypothetical protein CEXT_90131 [Caerostris extrusa]|uniref:Uncharacterized protein n=1 Tax=Caerostris extrusa TaxID=172846 RepID=A0AAV4UVN5_CAEEX|nr:hypothetical protein CEXT_90131 [Caerostris extrusa]
MIKKKIDTRAPSDLVACLAYFSVICHGRRHSGVHAPLPTPTGKDLAEATVRSAAGGRREFAGCSWVGWN